jgi:hypothetical protein
MCIAGCAGTSERKEAQAALNRAQALLAQNELIAARNTIDSVRLLLPQSGGRRLSSKETAILREALTLMRQVEQREAERNIAFCDSALPLRRMELEEWRTNFVLEKDSVYDELGRYVWKENRLERNIERSYVRAEVDERGEIALTGIYFGARPIAHTGLRLSTDNGLYIQTPEIPYDGGLNYRFTDSGNRIEIVTYKGQTGIDALQFIYDNASERIRVEYTGGKPYIIYMGDADKKAITATYRLSHILADIARMENEKAKAQKRIAYLEQANTQSR